MCKPKPGGSGAAQGLKDLGRPGYPAWALGPAPTHRYPDPPVALAQVRRRPRCLQAQQVGRFRSRLGFGLALLLAGRVASGAGWSNWQYRQEFELSAPGLVKLSLPAETLDVARPDLADLRLADEAGAEVPYRLEQPQPAGLLVQPARSFHVVLRPETTVIRLETGLAQPLGGVTLITPAREFIKAVRVEGSTDGQQWKELVTGQPIFRQPAGASQLRIALPRGVWPWLQLTVDDRASPPVPFTGAEVEAAEAEPAPTEPVPVRIAQRIETPGETRLVLDLGAAHLRLAELSLDSAEPLFRRPVTLSVRQVQDNVVRERVLATNTVYRVALPGQPPAACLAVPLDLAVPSRELVLTVHNGDSPPLQIRGVQVRRRPVYLVFLATGPGRFQLFSGHPLCPAPRYDVAGQSLDLSRAPLVSARLSPALPNPAYQPADRLPQVQDTGPVVDVAGWRYRKPVQLERPGVQHLELDLEVLAQAQSTLADLRLVRAGRQVPYVIERTWLTRPVKPEVSGADDPKQPQISRWRLKLPQPRLPVRWLSCASATPLFRRHLVLYEEPTDERGGRYRRTLGRAWWEKSPERPVQTLTLALELAPETDTLWLETHNEDNPAIVLTDFELAYPVTRLLFKTSATNETWLYYGQPQAAPPRYDLSLVADQLLRAEQFRATLGPQQPLKKPAWTEATRGGLLLWIVLGLVVVALLLLISRLMPKPPMPAG